jgi:predicted transposase YdaD
MDVAHLRNMAKRESEKALARGRAEGLAEGLEEGRAEGLSEGLEKGLEKGLAVGERNKSLSVAQWLIKSGMSIEQIAMGTGLSEEEVRDLADKID